MRTRIEVISDTELESVRDESWHPASKQRIKPALSHSRRDLTIATVVMAWVGLGLMLDANADIGLQRVLGAVTWLILVTLLHGENVAMRAQVAFVIVFATAVEYIASPLLGFYTYRLENVPSFVPPGHGAIYLAAMALGRSELFRLVYREVRIVVMVAGAAWVMWSMTLAERADALGALFFMLFMGFAFKGASPGIYVAAFLITTYLELAGTRLGNWTWASDVPGGFLSIGNHAERRGRRLLCLRQSGAVPRGGVHARIHGFPRAQGSTPPTPITTCFPLYRPGRLAPTCGLNPASWVSIDKLKYNTAHQCHHLYYTPQNNLSCASHAG